MKEIKNCPCCGGTAIIEKTGKNQLTISCKNCVLKMTAKYLRLSEEELAEIMIGNWNKRFNDKEKNTCSTCRHYNPDNNAGEFQCPIKHDEISEPDADSCDKWEGR